MSTVIIQEPHPTLRAKAKAVPHDAITSPEIKSILERMKKILATQEDGVAIAAPQIDEPWRIFVVSGRVHELTRAKSTESKPTPARGEDMVFINPKIIKRSREKEEMEEGCLSVRWQYGLVKRNKRATVEAYDEQGKKFTLGGAGLLAQIFQHETDHLDGVLFIDTATELQDLPPQKIEELERRNNSARTSHA